MPDAPARPQADATPIPAGSLPAGQLLALIAQSLPAVIWTTDTELRFTASLGRGLAEIGLKPGQVCGQSLFDYFQTTDPAFPPIAAHRAALRGQSQQYEFAWRERVFQVYVEPLRAADGAICGVLGLAVDITERYQAEQARLASEQQYRQLFENAHDVIFVLDLAGTFLSVNKAAERLTGYKRHELLGMNIAQLLDPAQASYVFERIQRALGGETRAEFELPVRTKDGRQVYVDVSAHLEFSEGRPAAIQGIARDITERKQFEERLRQAQKLEAIGELASGVAHDFNNLLTAILGYTDLLRSAARPGDLAYEAAEVIQKAGERAQQLAARLLGFARRGKAQDAAVDLHALLREVCELLQRTLPKNISLLERYDAERAVTRGDPGQLHQVFLNLALNARDAMPEGGVLMVRTEVVSVETDSFRELGTARPGPHVKISVADTGIGIPPEHLPHLFKPFFTTKQSLGGTGMGLAMVYGIVKNHGGAVRVNSRPGQGSVFEVYLPVVDEEPAVTPPARERAGRGEGTILVVDDEPMVARATVRLLESLGYRAAYVDDPRQVVPMLQQDPELFDLIILDMQMPGMSGPECLAAIRQVRPDLPVLVTSGYAGEGAIARVQEAGAAGFVPKPYSLPQLAEAVRRALGA